MADSIVIPASMKGAYLPGNRQCEVREFSVPQPGPGQVLVQTRVSALCGSDLSYIYRPNVRKTGAAGYTGVIAGHEPCGIIVKRGEGVLDVWKEGTRVVVYHIQGCGSCHHCRQGLYISCDAPERKAYGWQRDGGHGEFILVDVQSLVRLPEPLTYLDGAIVACGLGTAYAACSRAQVSGRDRVMITGLGPVGLGAALLAQKMGARVLGIEFDADRVMFARGLGIESLECVKGDDVEGGEDLKALLTWSAGTGVDVAIDCSGAASARITCLKATRSWGRVVFVGENGRVEFDVSEVVIHKSLAVYGSWVCSIGQMEELVERLVWWNLHPEMRSPAPWRNRDYRFIDPVFQIMVTNTFDIDAAAEAYGLFDSGKTGKCAIVYQQEKQVYHSISQ